MARCWAGKANTGDSRHRCPERAQPGKLLCIACEQAGLARVRERLVEQVQPWPEGSSAVRRVLVGRVNA